MAARDMHRDPPPPAVRTPDVDAPGEPPDILVTALVALLAVVAAVCVLAVTHSLWALLLAAGVMVAATLAVAFIIGLQLDQSERPQPQARRSAARPCDPNVLEHPDGVTDVPFPSREVMQAADRMLVSDPQRGDGGTGIGRLLFVADAAVADVDELPSSVRAIIDRADAIYVVTPTLPGRLAWLADDIDRCRHVADERLDEVLDHMHAIGAHASGAIRRGSVLTVIADAVARCDPDHMLLALRSPAHANWQERTLVAHVEQRFGLPVTTYVVDTQGHASAADGPLLLCYDGSEGAAHAIRCAGALFADGRALVLTVRQPTVAVGRSVWSGATDNMVDFFARDRAAVEHGARVADEGVRMARDAGLQAEPLAVEAAGTTWKTIVEIADRYDAQIIVLGSRGLTGVRSMLLQSVSSAAVHHAGRPTLVIRQPAARRF
jgi:nucleotide-binding universal stress UspA family protein